MIYATARPPGMVYHIQHTEIFIVAGYNLETGAPRCENPHKYLLFKPTPTQILVYLASGCNDLPPNGALLLYISADGQNITPSKHPEDGKSFIPFGDYVQYTYREVLLLGIFVPLD